MLGMGGRLCLRMSAEMLGRLAALTLYVYTLVGENV